MAATTAGAVLLAGVLVVFLGVDEEEDGFELLELELGLDEAGAAGAGVEGVGAGIGQPLLLAGPATVGQPSHV